MGDRNARQRRGGNPRGAPRGHPRRPARGHPRNYGYGGLENYERSGSDYGYRAKENYGMSGSYPLFRQECDQRYGWKPVEPEPDVPDIGDDVQALIRTVLDTLRVSGEDASEDPTKNLFQQKPKSSSAFPAYDQLDQIVLAEWKTPDRKMYVHKSYKQMYPFAKECLDLWATPPIVDPLFLEVCNKNALPATNVKGFMDLADKKVDNLFKMSFTGSGAALRANFVNAWVSRAMGQWCNDLVQSIRYDAPKQNLLRRVAQIQEANHYVCDAALEGAKFSARASALSVSARRALWLKLCPANISTKNLMISLPFTGKVIFGPELDRFVNQTRGGQCTLLPQYREKSTPSQDQSKKFHSAQNHSGRSRPPHYQTKPKSSSKGKKPTQKVATDTSKVEKSPESGSPGS
ncbi:lamina-associated polypeptide 2, isoforms alpha/zeta-like [Rhinophrynus dorsalis]